MFQLTADTDPSTIMFEGHPEIELLLVEPSSYEPNTFYVHTPIHPLTGERCPYANDQSGFNHSHSSNGRDRASKAPWPRIILRDPVIDTLRPLYVNHAGHPVQLIGVLADGNIAVAEDKNGWVVFDKYGKFVRSDGGDCGLTLRNPPIVTTYDDTLPASGQRVSVTETDGRVTKVELLK